MAYNKRTWATGNVVGAVDLNRMEGGIEENHPGYEYREEIVTLWEGSVTTEAEGDENVGTLSYTSQITADTLRVTFNGTIYDCPKQMFQDMALYGGWSNGMLDFSVFPFSIYSTVQDNGILTSTVGTYTVKLEEDNLTVSTTECFRKAVKSAVSDQNRLTITVVGNGYGDITDSSHTPQYVRDAVRNGKEVILKFYHTQNDDEYGVYYPVTVDGAYPQYDTAPPTGTYIRFQSQISWIESESRAVSYPIDIYTEDASQACSWVYNKHWDGRYPQ